MKGRPAAAQRVVVHGGQVVMHQRVAMDAFESRRGGQGLLFRDAKELRRLDQEERPEALTAAKRMASPSLAFSGERLALARRRSRYASTAPATRSSLSRKVIRERET